MFPRFLSKGYPGRYPGLPDDHLLGGDVAVGSHLAGGHVPDGLDHVKAVGHLAEHCIAPALGVLAGVVEKFVVREVDEELRRRGMGVRCPGHGNGPGIVAQPVIRLVDDGIPCGFLAHVGHMAAALDHEALDDPVEDHPVEEPRFDVVHKVLHGDGGVFGVHLQGDVTHTGFQDYHGIGLICV